MIVNYLADNSKVNITDAGLVIARGWRETQRILAGLEKKGVLVRSPGKYRSRHLLQGDNPVVAGFSGPAIVAGWRYLDQRAERIKRFPGGATQA